MDTCRKGHQDFAKNGKGQKVCRICRSEWQRERWKNPEIQTKSKAYGKEYRRKNVERHREYERLRNQTPERKRQMKTVQLRNKFNVTMEWYEAQLELQNNRCPICRLVLTTGKGPQGASIDHDHECCPDNSSCGDCVRGIICISCNKALGFFRDDRNNLEAALSYLEKWQSK